MRVLAINTVPTEKNGITNVIFNLYGAMDKRNIIVDYVSINKPDALYQEKVNSFGGSIFVIPRSMHRPFLYFLELCKVIGHGKYDIVHAHGNSATLAIEMLAAKVSGCQIRIAHSHNTTCKLKIVNKLLMPIFQHCCTHRLACGTAAGKWLFGKCDFKVVYNGVDTARFIYSKEKRSMIRDDMKISDSEIIIGHVGTFNEAKNQMFLLDILYEISQYNKEFCLLLIGDGALRRSVEERVLQLGLNNKVFFVGTTDLVQDYLSACDLIVMPSLYEGLPLALIEEQTNGLYCFVSDSITREVDKTGNLAFISLDMGAAYWAEKICNMQITELREERSDLAIKKVKACGYDIEENAMELLKYYHCILNEEANE